MKKKKNKKVPKQRDWLVVHAKGLSGRKGAGFHKDQRKEQQRRVCRGRVRN